MPSAEDRIERVAVTESKIGATERLRREGRWEEASAFRDEERRRLRTEGMSRRDASEEAWRRMTVKFAPLDRMLFISFYILAETPPRNCLDDAPAGEVGFRDVWWAYCRLAACCCWLDPDLVDIDELELLMADRMQHEPEPDEDSHAPNDVGEWLLPMAFEDPVDFLESVDGMLREALGRIEGTDDYATATKQELAAHLAILPELGETCEDLAGFVDGTVTFDDDTERMLDIAMNPQIRSA